ncbi:unnamed protein product, partial [Nesidiocoris tenuis]
MFSLPRFLLNHISFRTDRIRLPRLGRIRPQKSAFDRWCNQKIAPGRYESLPGQVSVCPCVCLFVCPCVRLCRSVACAHQFSEYPKNSANSAQGFIFRLQRQTLRYIESYLNFKA